MLPVTKSPIESGTVLTHDGAANADKEMTGTLAAQTEDEEHRRMGPPSLIDALAIQCHPEYKLVDAYPTLCHVYAIAVAVPVSSSTAERSFSALKRVKSRIRSRKKDWNRCLQ